MCRELGRARSGHARRARRGDAVEPISIPRNGAASAGRTHTAQASRAMASAYQKEFVMPEEFPATLRDFTREVLRDQPEDVAKYGYEYFLKKMEEAKAKAEGYAT